VDSERQAMRHRIFGPVCVWPVEGCAAVLAAVATPWSNGQVDGQVNRLKTIKRQMYGRAGFDPLRARVLPYAPIKALALQRAP
jgi:hypothetical protein